MNQKIKVLVADDHPIVIDGMRMLFSDHPGTSLIATASNYQEVLNMCNVHFPDLLILDINLGGDNSLEHVPELIDRYPKMKIVLFTSYDNTGMIRKAKKYGAHGYLLKDSTPEDWEEAISCISENKKYFKLNDLGAKPDELSEMNLDSFSALAELTSQEIRIVHEIGLGLSEQEIAEKLFLSKNTVHTHKKNIMRKIDVHSTAEIVRFAYENQLMV